MRIRTLTIFTLNQSWYTTLEDARRAIAAWREDYNTVHPHSSLGYLTPEEYAASVAAAGHANLQGGYRPPSAGSTQEVNATHRISFDQTAPLLETGFHPLYELDFQGAGRDFANYQKPWWWQ